MNQPLLLTPHRFQSLINALAEGDETSGLAACATSDVIDAAGASDSGSSYRNQNTSPSLMICAHTICKNFHLRTTSSNQKLFHQSSLKPLEAVTPPKRVTITSSSQENSHRSDLRIRMLGDCHAPQHRIFASQETERAGTSESMCGEDGRLTWWTQGSRCPWRGCRRPCAPPSRRSRASSFPCRLPPRLDSIPRRFSALARDVVTPRWWWWCVGL